MIFCPGWGFVPPANSSLAWTWGTGMEFEPGLFELLETLEWSGATDRPNPEWLDLPALNAVAGVTTYLPAAILHTYLEACRRGSEGDSVEIEIQPNGRSFVVIADLQKSGPSSDANPIWKTVEVPRLSEPGTLGGLVALSQRIDPVIKHCGARVRTTIADERICAEFDEHAHSYEDGLLPFVPAGAAQPRVIVVSPNEHFRNALRRCLAPGAAVFLCDSIDAATGHSQWLVADILIVDNLVPDADMMALGNGKGIYNRTHSVEIIRIVDRPGTPAGQRLPRAVTSLTWCDNIQRLHDVVRQFAVIGRKEKKRNATPRRTQSARVAPLADDTVFSSLTHYIEVTVQERASKREVRIQRLAIDLGMSYARARNAVRKAEASGSHLIDLEGRHPDKQTLLKIALDELRSYDAEVWSIAQQWPRTSLRADGWTADHLARELRRAGRPSCKSLITVAQVAYARHLATRSDTSWSDLTEGLGMTRGHLKNWLDRHGIVVPDRRKPASSQAIRNTGTPRHEPPICPPNQTPDDFPTS